ncbi:hypothetical protein KKF86_01720 [bacterium]|nr:hypothetical protein [bacterium]
MIEILIITISMLSVIFNTFKYYFFDKKGFTFIDAVMVIILFIFPTILLMGIIFFWEIPTIYHWGFVIIIITFQILTTISIITGFSSERKWVENIQMVVVMVPSIFSLFVLLVVFLTTGDMTSRIINGQISINDIENNFSRIKNSVADLEKIVQKETNEIDDIGNIILQLIKEKKKELAEIKTEQAILQKEVEYYKELSSVSKKDAELVLNTLRKSQIGKPRYIDRIIGFIIGVIASIVGSLIFKRIDKFKNILKK